MSCKMSQEEGNRWREGQQGTGWAQERGREGQEGRQRPSSLWAGVPGAVQVPGKAPVAPSPLRPAASRAWMEQKGQLGTFQHWFDNGAEHPGATGAAWGKGRHRTG